MSSTPSHHNETNYGRYTNWGQQATGRGIINNIFHQTTNYQSSPPTNPLDELEKHCSHSAAFDSAHTNPPRCAEYTRVRVIQIVENWVNSDGNAAAPSSLFWLQGGAGVGKSALAYLLSEKFHEKDLLAASFFFSKSDPTRNNGDHLTPTLVSHLVRTFKELTPFVKDSIRENPALFTKRYQTQIQELLVNPFIALQSTGARITHPRLIVIDGLDECDNPCDLLRVIARAISQIPYPLRFLVTTRQGEHITRFFNHDRRLKLQAIAVQTYDLTNDPDAYIDICNYLEVELAELRRVHPLKHHLPHSWPDQNEITFLATHASGYFIYASTVIRFLRSPTDRPDYGLRFAVNLQTSLLQDPPREGVTPTLFCDLLQSCIDGNKTASLTHCWIM